MRSQYNGTVTGNTWLMSLFATKSVEEILTFDGLANSVSSTLDCLDFVRYRLEYLDPTDPEDATEPTRLPG